MIKDTRNRLKKDFLTKGLDCGWSPRNHNDEAISVNEKFTIELIYYEGGSADHVSQLWTIGAESSLSVAVNSETLRQMAQMFLDAADMLDARDNQK